VLQKTLHPLPLKRRIHSWLARQLIAFLSHDPNVLRQALRGPRIWGPAERVHLGQRVEIQDALLNTVCGDIYIGDYTFCGHDCMFLTGTHDYQKIGLARQLNTGPTVGRDIKVGKGVWLASRVTVLGNLEISDNCVVCAGAVVVKSCLVTGIYAGVPASLIKRLDQLESQNNNQT
jgi:acetyltransferase-like isoleucine patch superfamily enzyme